MGLISCKYFFFGGLSEDKTEYHGIIYDNIIFINGIITTNCDDDL